MRPLAITAVTVCLKGIEQNMTYSLGEISCTWKGAMLDHPAAAAITAVGAA